MTRFRNVELDNILDNIFRQYQNTKTVLEKKHVGQNHVK